MDYKKIEKGVNPRNLSQKLQRLRLIIRQGKLTCDMYAPAASHLPFSFLGLRLEDTTGGKTIDRRGAPGPARLI